MRQLHLLTATVLGSAALALACSSDSSDSGSVTAPPGSTHGTAALTVENANANLEVILRGEGFGLVKFRQPKDEETVVLLDIWVRDLAPGTTYLLQRAVDTQVDDDCTSMTWLTLGRGLDPQAITTDDGGTGRASLFRVLPPTPGAQFDIHFQVIDAVTGAVVLQSDCYQFRISL